MKRKITVKQAAYDVLLAAMILTAAGSAAFMGIRLLEGRKQRTQMESLSALKGAGGAAAETDASGFLQEDGKTRNQGRDLQDGGGQASDSGADRARSQEGYRLLREQNPDFIGWLQIEDSPIDYPVMQSPDRPDYYLTHGFDGKKNRYGVPYAAESCDLSADCPNIIIYGHHMKDGTMFAGLMEYADQRYYEAHPLICFDTLTGMADYQIFGVVRETALPAGAAFFHAARSEDEAQFNEFVRRVKNKSLYDTNITAAYGDRLLTLVTCEYSRKEGRLLVIAKKISDLSGLPSSVKPGKP